jgi:hypothetical protein
LYSHPEYAHLTIWECINTHQYLYGIITDGFRKECYIAVGGVFHDDAEIFTFGHEEFSKAPFNPITATFPGHMWITFPSGLIVDGSLRWGIARQLGHEMESPVIDFNYQEMLYFDYRPFFVGSRDILPHLLVSDPINITAG